MKRIAAAAFLLACGGDAPCLVLPCPPPVAVIVYVRRSGLPVVIPAGATVSVNGGPLRACDASGVCRVDGGPGTYILAIRAPDLLPVTVSVEVYGTDAGCNSCGNVQTQRRDVELVQSAVPVSRLPADVR